MYLCHLPLTLLCPENQKAMSESIGIVLLLDTMGVKGMLGEGEKEIHMKPCNRTWICFTTTQLVAMLV